jgi:hypothetical protein
MGVFWICGVPAWLVFGFVLVTVGEPICSAPVYLKALTIAGCVIILSPLFGLLAGSLYGFLTWSFCRERTQLSQFSANRDHDD